MNLWQWETGLSWDPAVLNFTGIQEGSFLKSAGETLYEPAVADYANGNLPMVSSVLRSASSANGSGVLATVTFEVLSVSDTTIQLHDTVLRGSNTGHPEIAHSSVNGEVVAAPSTSCNIYLIAVAGLAIAGIIAAVMVLKKKKR
jgi:hypothetical protein